MKTLISNVNEIKKFYENVICIPPLGKFDIDFFCIAARKKYMTPEDRERTRLGDTCMMEKTIIRESDWDIFYHKLQKVDSCLDHLYSHNGANIPRECMVFYMNVNHTNMISALKDFKMDLATLEGELYDVFLKNGYQENIGNKVKRLDNMVLKSYQNPKNVSKRSWIDIDVDISDEALDSRTLRNSLDEMVQSKCLPEYIYRMKDYYVVVQTHGGYHILVDTRAISNHNKVWSDHVKENGGDFKKNILSVKDYTDTLERITVGLDAKEIKINQNAMVPIPGTIQGGKEVILYT